MVNALEDPAESCTVTTPISPESAAGIDGAGDFRSRSGRHPRSNEANSGAGTSQPMRSPMRRALSGAGVEGVIRDEPKGRLVPGHHEHSLGLVRGAQDLQADPVRKIHDQNGLRMPGAALGVGKAGAVQSLKGFQPF